jgi:hypothetical protein
VRQLHQTHGNNGDIEIWKEARDIKAAQYVRAYHQFDKYDPFFDWVNVKEGPSDDGPDYIPCKAVLLYRFGGMNYCMCWPAQAATQAERRHETHVSARWKMSFQANGLPTLRSVPLEDVAEAIFVYQHFTDSPHHFPQEPVSQYARSSSYIIDECYDRYSWALNYLDPDRWQDDTPSWWKA